MVDFRRESARMLAALTRILGLHNLALAEDVVQDVQIAAEHCAAASLRETNWEEILRLYDLLIALRPSPVVALNRAIAVGELRGPEEGLRALDDLARHERLARYPFLPAALGRFHLKAGRSAQAAECFGRALALARNPSEARLFDARLREANSAAFARGAQ